MIHGPKYQVGSQVCRQRDFSTDWYRSWRERISDGCHELKESDRPTWGMVWQGLHEEKTLHRKVWEWCAIAQALSERGFLTPGMTGIGFAVGSEPLASLFAHYGVNVLASDYTPETDIPVAWSATGQLASSAEEIHWPGLVEKNVFSERVNYKNIDMRSLTGLPEEGFDFAWSSCSFEHLGSLEAGLQFVINSTRLMKPGGVGVHTTEFNVSSNSETLTRGESVIYRKCDIEMLGLVLRKLGCVLEMLDFSPGSDQHDVAYDIPPYYQHGRQHVKLALGGHVTTSISLIVRKWL